MKSSFSVKMAEVSIFVALFFLCFFHFELLQCYDIKLPKPNISLGCESEGICDKVENYPRELVKRLIDKLQSQNTIFNYDEAPLPTVNMRFNEEEPLSLCEIKPQFVSPEGAKDMNGVWKFIINDPEEPLQVFRIEICRAPMGRCSENIGFIPGYGGACIQQTVFREMYYVDEKNNTGRTYFEVPTCCSCTLFRKHED